MRIAYGRQFLEGVLLEGHQRQQIVGLKLDLLSISVTGDINILKEVYRADERTENSGRYIGCGNSRHVPENSRHFSRVRCT